MAWYEQIFSWSSIKNYDKQAQFKSMCVWLGWGEQMLSTIKPKLSEWHTVAYIYITGIMKHMEHPWHTFHNKYINKERRANGPPAHQDSPTSASQ